MGHWLRFGTALAWLLVVLLVGYYLGLISVPGAKRETLQDIQEDYLAATISSDCAVAGEDPEVCEEIGRTVLRHSAKFGVSAKQIFKGGLTLVPKGYERGMYLRYLWWAQKESESWDAVLDTALKVTKEAGGLAPLGCATHYIRAPRDTDSYAQPEDAANTIRRTMTSEGRYKDKGKTEFFCPKE